MKEPSVPTVCDGLKVYLPGWDWKPLAHGKGYAMISNPDGVEGIVEAVCAALGERPRNILASRLIPGQVIEEHTDDAYHRRVHVPLKTNPMAFFIAEGQRVHMKVGKAYLVDPSKPHSAVNEGHEDRIHLMFDLK